MGWYKIYRAVDKRDESIEFHFIYNITIEDIKDADDEHKWCMKKMAEYIRSRDMEPTNFRVFSSKRNYKDINKDNQAGITYHHINPEKKKPKIELSEELLKAKANGANNNRRKENKRKREELMEGQFLTRRLMK